MTSMVWFITGCTSGFGEHFVHALRARGDRVIATGRNATTRLQHLKDAGVAVMNLDVTAPQTTLDHIIAQAMDIYGGIDVLVNNAGYIESGALEELTHERMLRELNTNFFGPLNLARSLLPHFRQKQGGILAFIGSQAGWHADPGASAYCASKFALAGAVECLQKEVEAFGIQCIVFEPGYYRTNALKPGNLKREQPHISAYAEFNKASAAFEAAAFGNEPGDPKKAVDRMIDVVKKEGMAKDKNLPIRLPLGTDGLKVVREKCSETLEVCKEYEALIVSTDIKSEA